MTDLDALQDRLSEAAVLTDRILKKASGDYRMNLYILRNQLGGALNLVVCLTQARDARGGRDVLSLGARQQLEGEGRPNVELVDTDEPGPA